jgi:hypothetical protein
MRGRTLVVALFCVAALAAPSTALSGATQSARLRLVQTAPLTLRGVGFRPHERVRVVYATDRTWTVRTIADAAGALTVRFRTVHFDPCDLPRISAVGARGSRAVLKLVPPACPAP